MENKNQQQGGSPFSSGVRPADEPSKNQQEAGSVEKNTEQNLKSNSDSTIVKNTEPENIEDQNVFNVKQVGDEKKEEVVKNDIEKSQNTNDLGDNSGNNTNSNQPDISQDKGDYPGNTPQEPGAGLRSIIRVIIIIMLVVLAIWFFNRNDENVPTEDENSDDVNIIIDDEPQNGNVIIDDGENGEQNNQQAGENEVIVTAFYNLKESDDCEVVYPVDRVTEKKYDSDVVNTLRALLTPLDAEKANKYVSNIPEGTYLIRVDVDGSGMATVKLSNHLSNVGGSCRVLAIRKQIEKTLTQFSYINDVTICIENNCNQDEILQP